MVLMILAPLPPCRVRKRKERCYRMRLIPGKSTGRYVHIHVCVSSTERHTQVCLPVLDMCRPNRKFGRASWNFIIPLSSRNRTMASTATISLHLLQFTENLPQGGNVTAGKCTDSPGSGRAADLKLRTLPHGACTALEGTGSKKIQFREEQDSPLQWQEQEQGERWITRVIRVHGVLLFGT